MELVSVQPRKREELNTIQLIPAGKNQYAPADKKEYKSKPFIEANTKEVSLSCLQNDCVIPVFSKDNERTIAHQEFIEIAQETVSKLFPNETIDYPEIRASHQIKGRIPSAIHKPAKELLDQEKTQYFERMAFIIRIPSITETVNGNKLSLTVGGVRAYNQENLYSRKSFEKFKFFIGFQNMVCCNLCISTDGYQEEMRVSNYFELQEKISQLIGNYNPAGQLKSLQELTNHSLTEQQFAQLIGKARLYNYLPKKEKLHIPEILLNDGQISTIAKDYYSDESFCRDQNGDISLWNVYNLFTGANKSSYIDSYLTRGANVFNFSKTLNSAVSSNSSFWFLK